MVNEKSRGAPLPAGTSARLFHSRARSVSQNFCQSICRHGSSLRSTSTMGACEGAGSFAICLVPITTAAETYHGF